MTKTPRRITLYKFCFKTIFLIILAMLFGEGAFAASYPNIDNATLKYYDINLDGGAWENSVGETIPSPNTDGHFKPSTVIEEDSIKGNKVARITGSGASGNFGVIRDKGISITSITPDTVVWYEFSFKFEEKISPVRIEAGEWPCYIQENGKLLIGGLQAGTYIGAEISSVTLEAGEWYHLVIAVDNIDKWAGTDVKYYAWLNGTFLTTGETPTTGCTVSKGYSSSPGYFGYWFFIPEDGSDVNVCFDDMKLYTTSEKVKNNGEFCFDPNVIYEGASLASDLFKIESNTIYAPENETLSEMCLNMTSGEKGIAAVDENGVITETDMLITGAVGKTIIARSDSGIGVKKYTVAAGRRLYDIDKTSVVWNIVTEDENSDPVKTPFTTVSSLNLNDEVEVSFEVKNDTSSFKTGYLVLASYNGTALTNCSFVPISIPEGGITVTSAKLLVKNTENLSLKAYIWESSTDYTPSLSRIELNS